jgi:isoleucyl-tRNA synthetase
MFKNVPSKVDFVELERRIQRWWKENDEFNKLRQLRAGNPRWSFLDGPITANNPMGVHHAWGRTYKDLFQRFRAMQGYDERWQNGFDCQGLWVEVNVEKDLGFKSKRDIEAYGLAEFVILCKQRVLNFAAVQTEQSIRLGMWMDWNDPDHLRWLRDKLGENPQEVVTYHGPDGTYTDTVEQVVGHLGLPELGGSYYTFSNENNYMIWAFLSKCHENGWIYKGTDVMPWCARCGTGVSEHEISTEDYPDLTHPSLTVRLPLKDHPNEYLLVWTTTPWTLTSNVAVAAGPELKYLQVKQGDEVYYLSEGTQHMLKGPYEVLGTLAGLDMEGWTYVGPFDDLPAVQEVGGHVAPELRNHVPRPPVSAAQAHRVIMWKDVSSAEGTGLVHIAPGCGAEDFMLGKEFGLPIVAPLDENGVFIEGFGPFTGMRVFDVAPVVAESLKQKGMFYRGDPYTHRYPTCWRCKTELVFRLVDEWYISMGPVYDKPREELTPEEKARSLRYQIMDVVDQIRWIPGFGYEREMDWLRNMHDWMISKKRYWGLALPIWECENCGRFEVVGSREELERRAVAGLDVLNNHTPHRPYVDAVKLACSECGSKASRVKDVGNPWLDAGIVPFSTLRYRTDRAYFEKWFPADFVSESFPGQFRNWFYSLLAMSTVVAHEPPFKALMGYGTLVAEDGRPMHKSLGNMIEFNEAADTIGADVMRWMYASQRYESNMLFGYHVADETRRMFLLPLWNVYSFFVTYANLDNWKPDGRRTTSDGRSDLDRWILSRLQQVIAEVTEALEEYDAPRATRALMPFVDDLSNWYLRRSRRRFWKSEADADKEAAYATLYEVLVAFVKLLAPFIPFVTEELYQNLVRSVDASAPESVHHCDWPKADASLLDEQLLNEMATIRTIVRLGHAIRGENNLKVRQPLNQVLVFAPPAGRHALVGPDNETWRDRVPLIKEELNVKSFLLVNDQSDIQTFTILPNNRVLGPKFGSKFLKVRAALSTINPQIAVTASSLGEMLLFEVEGEKIELAPDEYIVTAQAKPGFAVKDEGGLVVALDTTITPELEREGLAREFVRQVQTMRKDAGFNIEDRIVTHFDGASDKIRATVRDFGDYIKRETLSTQLVAEPPASDFYKEKVKLDSEQVELGIKRVQQ